MIERLQKAHFYQKFSGFSLTEIIIALALLGLLTVFTVPKLLSSSSTSYNSIAKDDIAAISTAFMRLKSEGKLKPSTSNEDIMALINHLGRTTSDWIDGFPQLSGPFYCGTSSLYCYLMQNGSLIYYVQNFRFREFANDPVDDGNNYALRFGIDPNRSRQTSDLVSPEKSLEFFLYYNGQIRTLGQMLPSTSGYWPGPGITGQSGPSIDPTPTSFQQYDPSWFSW